MGQTNTGASQCIHAVILQDTVWDSFQFKAHFPVFNRNLTLQMKTLVMPCIDCNRL